MKWWFPIGCLLIGLVMMVASCETSTTSPRPSPGGEGEARWKLEAIDSLMWKEPDSALAVMMEFAANVEADSMDAFEGHYCQLLISELLYKNDYGQSNRKDLLKAVDYFDSLATGTYGADTRGVSLRRGDGITIKERNVFLDARAHYINGVGFYERNDVVQACAEYLKALEVMEDYFEDKELAGKKAIFMTYTCNRLMELFSAQFMMDPAIESGERALRFCRIEPTSSLGIPNILYRIGKQYDKMNEIDKAVQYYELALESIPDTDNVVYRDIISNKALCDYLTSLRMDQPLKAIRTILVCVDSENERLNRYLTIGGIFFHEGVYDSALLYLQPVFKNCEDEGSQIQAANYLHIIYESVGNREQSDFYLRFLTNHKKSEGENKALVSKLEGLFNDYMVGNQKKDAEVERKKSIEKTVRIIVPIAIAVALVLLVVSKLSGWKKLKQQQAEADRKLGEKEQEHEKELRLCQVEAEKTLEETIKKHEEALKSKETEHEQEMKAKQAEALQQMEVAQRIYEEELRKQQAETERLLDEAERKHQQKVEDMVKRHEAELRIQKDRSEKEIEQTRQRHKAELEAERLAYQKEREELQLSLQLSKRSVNTLQEELGRKRTDAKGHYEAFLREPVCVKINDMVRDLHITTRKPYSSYHVNLDDETLAQFGQVVSAYYSEVKPALLCLYPGIAQEDLLLCYLYLLGMENKHVAATRQREYSTVRKQAGELKRRLGIEESVRDYVLHVAGVEEFVEE